MKKLEKVSDQPLSQFLGFKLRKGKMKSFFERDWWNHKKFTDKIEFTEINLFEVKKFVSCFEKSFRSPFRYYI